MTAAWRRRGWRSASNSYQAASTRILICDKPCHTQLSLKRASRTTHIMISQWASGHNAPRRSHDQNPPDSRKMSRSSSPDESAEPRRRSSSHSDATPRQTPASTRFLVNAASDQDTSKNLLPSEGFSSSKRLGYFADKLTSSLSGTTHPANQKSPSQLLHPHSHTHSARGESPLNPASLTLSPAAMASSSNLASTAKSHTSPSKVGFHQTTISHGD